MAIGSTFRCTVYCQGRCWNLLKLSFDCLLIAPYEISNEKRLRFSTRVSQAIYTVRTGLNSKAASFPAKTKIVSSLQTLQKPNTTRPGGKDPNIEIGPVKWLLKVQSFQPRHFQKAKRYLDQLLRYGGSPKQINATWQIFDRLVSETANSDSNQRYHWFCEPEILNAHLKAWRKAVLRPVSGEVLSPNEMLRKILVWSKKFPQMRYNSETLQILFKAFLQQKHQPCQDVVALIEEMLHKLDSRRSDGGDEASADSSMLTTAVYNHVLRYYMGSTLPGISSKVEFLFEKMQQSSSTLPDEETYSIIMESRIANPALEQNETGAEAILENVEWKSSSIWSTKRRQGIIDSIDDVLKTMKHAGIEPSLKTSILAVKGYALSGGIQIAEDMLMATVRKVDTGQKDKNLSIIADGARYILEALCREVVQEPPAQDLRNLLQRAENLVDAVKSITTIDPSSADNKSMETSLVKLFVTTNEFDQLENLLLRRFFDNSKGVLESLIDCKENGDKDMAMRTTKLVEKMLKTDAMKPEKQIFHALIKAWANSSQHDALKQAFFVLRLLLKHDGTCMESGIQKIKPDGVVNELLWKCLSKQMSIANKENLTELILGEVKSIMQSYDTASLDEEFLKTTIKMALVATKDLDWIDEVFRQLIVSGLETDTKFFFEILERKVRENCVGTAQLVEHILWKMRQVVEPDMLCFNIVLQSLSRMGTLDAAERTWQLFQLLVTLRLQPDCEFLTTLIFFLSSTGNLKMLNRAEHLLNKIIDNAFPGVSPDHRLFIAVSKGWTSIGHAQRAEKLLFLQNDLYFAKKILKRMPIPVNYDVIMHAYIKAGKIRKATKFIYKLDELNEQEQLSLAPEIRTYRSLLSAWKRWSNSHSADKDYHISKLEAKISLLVKNS